jgi:exonuclease III
MTNNLKSPFSVASSYFNSLRLNSAPSAPGLTNENLSWERNKDVFTATNQFTVASFNLLAPCYKRLPANMRESSDSELWTKRVAQTIDFCHSEIYGDGDIIGFQEYWLDSDYTALFKEGFDFHGYEVRHLKRTGKKTDSVAIAVKKDVFEILGSENIYLCSIGDRVALVLHLCHKATGKTVLVANTHLSFPHSSFDRVNQMQQMKKLTNAMSQYAAKHGIQSATRIVLGDFNVNSSSQVCDHLRKAGYFSCFEVEAPSNLLDTMSTSALNIADVANGLSHSSFSSPQRSQSTNSGLGIGKSHQFECDSSLDFDRSQIPRAASISILDDNKKHVKGPGDEAVDYNAATSYYATPRFGSNSVGEDPRRQSLPPQASNPLVSPAPSFLPGPVAAEINPTKNVLDFVSHRTHDSNDVGVDHIFVKPELEIELNLMGDAVSPYDAVTPVPPRNILLSTRQAPPSRPPVPPSSTSQPTIVMSNELLSPWSEVLSGLFVSDSTVLPRSLICDQWHTQFTISDHRPVSSTLLFASRNPSIEDKPPASIKAGIEEGGVDAGVGEEKSSLLAQPVER